MSDASANPVAEIIEAKGGPAPFAEAIGTNAGEVMVWRSRKRIPRTRWLEIHEAFPDLDSEALKRANGEAA